MKKIPFIFVIFSLILAACSTAPSKQAAVEVPSEQITASKPAYNVDDYYLVYQDGRIYVFDDFQVYQEFLELGETTFRLTRIGAGPEGETVVFGLRKTDKEKPAQSGVVNMYDGKAEGIKLGFYGEVVKNGRVYIFSEWEDMQSFVKLGEATFRYTDIGAGAKGETLVYVLNSNNKNNKPVVSMTEYKKRHQ